MQVHKLYKSTADKSYGSYGSSGVGRGTPLYTLYRYVLPQATIWFLSHCGLIMGMDFNHFALNV